MHRSDELIKGAMKCHAMHTHRCAGLSRLAITALWVVVAAVLHNYPVCPCGGGNCRGPHEEPPYPLLQCNVTGPPEIRSVFIVFCVYFFFQPPRSACSFQGLRVEQLTLVGRDLLVVRSEKLSNGIVCTIRRLWFANILFQLPPALD